MTNDLLFLCVGVVSFSIVHSLTASLSFKHWLRKNLGESLYQGWFRLFYNLLSSVTLAPLLLLAVGEGTTLWKVEGNIVYLFQAIRVGALLGILHSIQQIDWKSFIGIRQVMAYFQKSSAPAPHEKLVLAGMYRFTRHPLYLFSILFLWSKPTMTIPWLAFSTGATLYFLIGSVMEERKMVLQYRTQYENYQKTVPWLIPFLHRRKN